MDNFGIAKQQTGRQHARLKRSFRAVDAMSCSPGWSCSSCRVEVHSDGPRAARRAPRGARGHGIADVTPDLRCRGRLPKARGSQTHARGSKVVHGLPMTKTCDPHPGLTLTHTMSDTENSCQDSQATGPTSSSSSTASVVRSCDAGPVMPAPAFCPKIKSPKPSGRTCQALRPTWQAEALSARFEVAHCKSRAFRIRGFCDAALKSLTSFCRCFNISRNCHTHQREDEAVSRKALARCGCLRNIGVTSCDYSKVGTQ